jgi:peptidylprolyl isomerase
METVSDGLFVSVDYKGTLENGQVFDTSEGRQPLEIKMGAGQLIKGFENALMGMSLNEKKTFTLSPEEAYGPFDESRQHTFPRADVPTEMDPQVGQSVGLTTQDGRQIPARIIAVDDDGVTVDLNHPLAGQALTFEIEVVGISATPTQAAGCGCGCDCSSNDGSGDCSAGESGSGCGCH